MMEHHTHNGLQYFYNKISSRGEKRCGFVMMRAFGTNKDVRQRFCPIFYLLSCCRLTSLRQRHLPYANGVVTVTGEQSLAIGGPGQRQALWWIGLGRLRNDLGAQLFNGLFACQILSETKKT